MDLGAYAQIDTLEKVMLDNNIKIPRLRGLRLMSEEEPILPEDYNEAYRDAEFDAVRTAVESKWLYNPLWLETSYKTDYELEYYMDFAMRNGHINHFKPLKIHWERLHGRKRKLVKYLAKKRKQRIKTQWDMWNKYCGRDDVLYIHARLGSGNWGGYDCDKLIKDKPWYLDHCEDNFDQTYVDIYAKIV